MKKHDLLWVILVWVLMLVSIGLIALTLTLFSSPRPTRAYYLEEFPSADYFKAWGRAQPLLMMSGQNFNAFTNDNDCDVQAEFLVRRAIEQGWMLSLCPVDYSGKVLHTSVVKPSGYLHVGTWTTIGNEYWYLDSLDHSIVVRINATRR